MPSMKRFKDSILSRTKSSGPGDATAANDDSPEGVATRGVRDFCLSGSPENQGEEVLHLPVIVEAAESSPAAASVAAYNIRKFLSKDNYEKPHVQYNAIMLLRILCENPGPAFTKNIDSKFVNTTATLLRSCRQPSVQQILRETLDVLEAERSHDQGLKKLIEMWRLNKGFNSWFNVPSQFDSPQPGRGHGGGRPKLPPPVELASRLEESKNSGKILIQLVQSTPPEEMLNNDLIKEFVERCQNAQRSMQVYINSDDPAPDPDTLQTLIEVSEQLNMSLSKHQRAVLNARRTLGLAPSNPTSPAPEAQNGHGGQPVYGNSSLSPDPSNRPNYLTSSTPPLANMPALSPEPRQAQRGGTSNAATGSSYDEDGSSRGMQDPFSDSAEPSTWQTGGQPPPRSMHNANAHELPATNSGLNGAGSNAAPQPVVYRY